MFLIWNALRLEEEDPCVLCHQLSVENWFTFRKSTIAMSQDHLSWSSWSNDKFTCCLHSFLGLWVFVKLSFNLDLSYARSAQHEFLASFNPTLHSICSIPYSVEDFMADRLNIRTCAGASRKIQAHWHNQSQQPRSVPGWDWTATSVWNLKNVWRPKSFEKTLNTGDAYGGCQTACLMYKTIQANLMWVWRC